jgi:hypothetical protein
MLKKYAPVLQKEGGGGGERIKDEKRMRNYPKVFMHKDASFELFRLLIAKVLSA